MVAHAGFRADGAGDGPDPQERLFAAATDGDVATLREILTRRPELKDIRKDGGWSLLHTAQSSREAVAYLIGIGCDLEAKSGADWTPLHSQAYYGHVAGVELLLDHGADIEAKTTFGITPLSSAVRWNRIAAARRLLERGAHVDPTTAMGRTPLMVSTIEGQSELAGLFIEHGAALDVRDANYGRTPLHFAALYGQLDIVEALVDRSADLEAVDGAGRTPLDYAVRYGHEKVARLLNAAGAAGEVDPANFGPSARLAETLAAGEAFAWYLGDSGYAVKTANHLLLFNYNAAGCEPDEPRLANGRIRLDEIAGCRTLVFASRHHHAHHHPRLFREWQRTHPDITFVYAFEDTLGRDERYFEDVPGPDHVHLPGGERRRIGDASVEAIPVSRFGPCGAGFLVEVDGLTIFCGGDHLLSDESEWPDFREPIDTLKARDLALDILILPANFAWGRLFPANLQGLDYAIDTLAPRALLLTGGDSTEYLFAEVAAALEPYRDRTAVFCPEHGGDPFALVD